MCLPCSQRTDPCSQLCSELSRPEASRTSFEHVAAVNTDAAVSGAISGGNMWERSTGHVTRLSEFCRPSCLFHLPLNSRKNSLQTSRSTGSAVSFSNDTLVMIQYRYCHGLFMYLVPLWSPVPLMHSPLSLLPLFAVQGLDDSNGDSVTGFLAEQLRHRCQADKQNATECKYLPHVSLNWLPG